MIWSVAPLSRNHLINSATLPANSELSELSLTESQTLPNYDYQYHDYRNYCHDHNINNDCSQNFYQKICLYHNHNNLNDPRMTTVKRCLNMAGFVTFKTNFIIIYITVQVNYKHFGTLLNFNISYIRFGRRSSTY